MQRSLLTAGLAGLAAVLIVVTMFTPWATAQDSSTQEMPGAFGFGGGSFRMDMEWTVYFWEGDVSMNGAGEDFSWFDGDMDDADGVGLLRTGAVMLTVALAAAIATAVLAGLSLMQERLRMPSLITGAATTLVALVGLILFSTGANEFLDEVGGVFHVGFYLGIVAVLAVAASAIVPVLPVGDEKMTTADFD